MKTNTPHLETRIGDEGLFLNGDVIERIVRSGPELLQIYFLLCGMAAEVGTGTFPLDLEYLVWRSKTDLKRVHKCLIEMERLSIAKIKGDRVTIDFPNEQERKDAV